MANGIFGLRPTLGCYNYSDALVLATFTRDTVGRSQLLFPSTELDALNVGTAVLAPLSILGKVELI